MKIHIAAGAFFIAYVLLVNTGLVAAEELLVRKYDVSKLAPSDDDKEYLIEAITDCVQPTSWTVVGSKGSIFAEPKDVLVVHQTAETQEEIGALLAALSKLRKVERRTLPGKSHPHFSIKPADAKSLQRLVVYDVLDLVRKVGGDDDYDSLIEEIARIAPSTWDTVGGPGTIGVIPSRGALIVSQTVAVHRSIGEMFAGSRKK